MEKRLQLWVIEGDTRSSDCGSNGGLSPEIASFQFCM